MHHPKYMPPELDDALRVRVKTELRKSIQRIRSTLPEAARLANGEAIRRRLLELGIYDGATCIALYRAIDRKGEIDTTGIDADARARGLRVAYPSIDAVDPACAEAADPTDPDEARRRALAEPPRTMSMRWVDDEPSSIEERGHGFPEPADDAPLAPPGELDVVIVPGLAFDPEGNRIGYGAGFYDRFLAAAARAKTLGVCFDFQVIAEAPVMPTDVPVQRVVTEKRAFARSAR